VDPELPRRAAVFSFFVSVVRRIRSPTRNLALAAVLRERALANARSSVVS